ncbi:hypothetical protein NDU88_008438 [Pleurodeles waltl]|uniref:Uncharacterized protein n=1 Tax=Pleurodeles waltl TaxID=8319 RepID=A0AAV7QNM9_PLEWA|nr:hypothetical protein NDU88_008438 [Pleurodeles waltl]
MSHISAGTVRAAECLSSNVGLLIRWGSTRWAGLAKACAYQADLASYEGNSGELTNTAHQSSTPCVKMERVITSPSFIAKQTSSAGLRALGAERPMPMVVAAEGLCHSVGGLLLPGVVPVHWSAVEGSTLSAKPWTM